MPFDGTTYKHDEVLDLLRRARERVARLGGWCQRDMVRGEAVCAIGSVRAFNLFLSGTAVKALYDVLLERWQRFNISGHEWYNCVIQYNDAPGRTQAEIVALFDRAIARLVGAAE